jgi:hypothetical protein
MNQYLANQFSGNLAQAVINALQSSYEQYDSALAYLTSLSIDTATTGELENIGLLVGLPWPTVPAGYINDNGFQLGSYLLFPETDPDHGVGSVSGSTGGHLGSVFNNVGDLIPEALYRTILKAYAILKYENITIHSIDVMSNAIGIGYMIQIPRIFFTFGDASDWPTIDASRGFGDVGSATGGPFASSNGSVNSDIYIVFPADTPVMNIYVLQQVLNRVTTDPQIFIAKAVS